MNQAIDLTCIPCIAILFDRVGRAAKQRRRQRQKLSPILQVAIFASAIILAGFAGSIAVGHADTEGESNRSTPSVPERIIHLGDLIGNKEPEPAFKYCFYASDRAPDPLSAVEHFRQAGELIQGLQDSLELRDSAYDLLNTPNWTLADSDRAENIINESEEYRDTVHRGSMAAFHNRTEPTRLPTNSPVNIAAEATEASMDAFHDGTVFCRLHARWSIEHGNWSNGFSSISDLARAGIHLNNDGELNSAFELIELWISTPESPNLYWALTTLELHRAASAEFASNWLIERNELHSLQNPEELVLDEVEWESLIAHDIVRLLTLRSKSPFANENAARPGFDEILSGLKTLLPQVRGRVEAELISLGYEEADLDLMPDGQVISIREKRAFDAYIDGRLKWHALGPYERRLHMRNGGLEGYRAIAHNPRESGIFVNLWRGRPFLEAFALCRDDNYTAWRDALRCVEAVRLHVGNSEVPLESLSDIECVPVPVNPVSNTEFDFERSDSIVRVSFTFTEDIDSSYTRTFQWTLDTDQEK